MIYKPVDQAMARLEHAKNLSDDELIDLARRNTLFPLQMTIMFLIFVIGASSLNYIVYLAHDIGAISSFSITGGLLAGAFACPFMVFGAFSLILRKNTECIARHVDQRKLEVNVTRLGIFPKLLTSFIGVAVGISIWLSYTAFYTGINQTINEIHQGQNLFLKALSQSGKDWNDQAGIVGHLETEFPGTHFFMTDKKGSLIEGDADAIDIPRWEKLRQTLHEGFASGKAGSLYNNVHESVIAWAPVGENRIIGTVSTIKERLGRFSVFGIWCGIFVVIGFSVGLILAITNVLATSHAIQKAVSILQNLSEGEGDLTTRLAVTSEDETGDLARKFNLFADKLHQIIHRVVEKTNDVGETARNFTNLSGSMNADLVDLNQETDHVARQAVNTRDKLTDVSMFCESTTETVNQIAAAAEQMANTVTDVAKRTEEAHQVSQEAVSTTREASEKITQLGSAAHDIDKVTEVINEISEQINLLALNATIESARAGEAGKGFAVVANEIKDLARQTAEATQEIKDRINGIQNSTGETVHDMERISTVIESVNEIVFSIAGAVEEQSATTREIAQNISHASEGINDVNQGVASGTDAARDISAQIEGVKAKADGVSSNSAQVNDGSRNLLHIADELKDLVSKFKI